jgi:hypothetical protein
VVRLVAADEMRLSYVVASVAFSVMGWVGVFRLGMQAEELRDQIADLRTQVEQQLQSPCTATADDQIVIETSRTGDVSITVQDKP